MAAAVASRSSVLLCGLLVLVVVVPAWGLRCWVCSSEEGGYCGDPFNATHLWQSDCPPERRSTPRPYSSVHMRRPPRFPVCKKVKQRERGQLVFVRSCGYEALVGEACDPEGDRTFSDDVQFCQTCDLDGCNSAPLARAGLGVAAASISAALLARLLLAHSH